MKIKGTGGRGGKHRLPVVVTETWILVSDPGPHTRGHQQWEHGARCVAEEGATHYPRSGSTWQDWTWKRPVREERRLVRPSQLLPWSPSPNLLPPTTGLVHLSSQFLLLATAFCLLLHCPPRWRRTSTTRTPTGLRCHRWSRPTAGHLQPEVLATSPLPAFTNAEP